ncbi:MAG TPA: N-formylglutamate amidohydrolase, partial [Gemmatimonadales bacterium]|nr:N-formylglutamate amidohydrolase [Gemmatimonadales bacterium]
MRDTPFLVERSDRAPIAVAAIHDGHRLRLAVAKRIALSSAERLREEDPYTAQWTALAGTRLIGYRSRFEVDLNRPRETAVYREPADAWGLTVWRRPVTDLLAGSLKTYDAFYAAALGALSALRERFGHFVVLDLHSYNHRRDGPDQPPADPALNPEINVGTGALSRAYWAPVIDRFLSDLRQADVLGRRLDVRENVRFRGGHFAAWVQQQFPGTGCVLAVEVKKFFMDEWTGLADIAQL